MSEALFSYSVPQFVRGINVAKNLLQKLREHAQSLDIEESVLINDRLYCNMFDFKGQIQIISDTAKNTVARLSQQEAPAMADTEATLDELEARLDKTLEYIGKATAADFAGAELRAIVMGIGPEAEAEFKNGTDYLQGFALPNFYFHLTTAYNLLRKNGIQLVKQDFIGAIDIEVRPIG